MDVPAQINESRTMVPLRFISEFFGAIVTWNGQTQGILILLANISEAPESNSGPLVVSLTQPLATLREDDETDIPRGN